MVASLLGNESTIRLALFAILFFAMAVWEIRAPRRRQAIGREQRLPSNLGVIVLDTLIVRLLFHIGSVALALLA
jgi:hypothetical protein